MSERDVAAYIRALIGMVDRTVECFELLDEVKTLDSENHSLTCRLALRGARIRHLEAELELERSRYCLGGVPPVPSDHWVNEAITPPSTASDPSSPPLRRGLVRKPGGAK